MSQTLRVYRDQWEAAVEYAAKQIPPSRPEDVIRYWLGLGIEAHVRREKRRTK